MSKTFMKAFTAVFILTQVCLTIYFIWDAATDWQQSPSVTSVSVKRAQKETFPAVTLCYPNTWKWPGLIKVLSQTVEKDQDFLEDLSYDMKLGDFAESRGFSSSNGFHKMTPSGSAIDLCRFADHFFRNQKDHKEFFKWLFLYIGNVEIQNKNGNDRDSDKEEEADTKIHDILKEYTTKKVLTTDMMKSIKDKICDMDMIDCEKIDTKQCIKADIGDQIMQWIHKFWVNQRYDNTETMMQMIQKKFFDRKFNNTDWKAESPEDLYKINKHVYKKLGFNPFLAWHFLNGIFVSSDDKFADYLLNRRDEDLQKLWNKGIYNGTGRIDEEYQCYDQSTCQPTIKQLQKTNEEKLKEFLDLAMSEPQAHAGNFAFIPMCNFGSSSLKVCQMFNLSKGSYQDDSCFTFDPKDNPNDDSMVMAEKEDGLHLALNVQDIPHDYGKKLRLKLLLHKPGTFPDVLSLDSNFIEIIPNQETNVAINDIISEEVTETFMEMSLKKRQCLISGKDNVDNNQNYSRTSCLTKHIYNFALEQCRCQPWTLNVSYYGIQTTYPRCNFTGSACFRGATTKGKVRFDSDDCPHNCLQKHYKTSITTDDYNKALLYGDAYMDFLANNPTGILMSKAKQDSWGETKTIDDYYKLSGQSYSIFHIFLDKPEVTIITKDAKVTVPDMVSNIGGTIGIFLGLSTLNMLELLIEWFQKAKTSCNKRN